MNSKSDYGKNNKDDFLYSHIFYQRDCGGRGEGWYFMLSHNEPYGPFPDKDVANTIIKELVIRLENGESEEDFQKQG